MKMKTVLNWLTVLSAVGIIYVGINISGIQDKLSSNGERLSSVETKVDNFGTRLDRFEMFFDKVVTVSASPKRLTKYGEELAIEINADEIVEPLVKKFKTQINGLTNYRIQKLSYDYFYNDYKPTLHMEDIAFDEGIEMKAILDVLAIKLRDQLLMKR